MVSSEAVSPGDRALILRQRGTTKQKPPG